MDVIRKYSGWAVAAAFALGLIIGLPILGWWLWPVEWTEATPAELATDYQTLYVNMVAELYSFNGDTGMVQQALAGWDGELVACQMAASSTDPAERARLEAIAAVASGGVDCATLLTQAPVEEEGASNILIIILLLFLLLLLIVAAMFYVLRRRNGPSSSGREPGEPVYEDISGAPAATYVQEEEEITAVPLARFHTTYTHGHDQYDESFAIENSGGEFLGECGVGIAESIGTDSPRNVTAFEIWLFDKSDVRTITKVVMSDHAFFDEALKAKLAPKGEPVLAREHETIVLETASLIINAEITEMDYGTDTAFPPQSYFDRFTVALSAWSKEAENMGMREQNSGADAMMDF